ncbi:MAG: hypothetical protein IJR59_07075 [Firmicutes bacterium]|nr:hypothetical protein [Bacillota bacterium]
MDINFNIINIAGFVVCAVILAAAVERHTPWAAVLISLCTGAAVVLCLLPRISEIADSVRQIFGFLGQGRAGLLLKVVGISFIAQITAQTCRDAGQKAMGDKIELAARVFIAAYSLPLISEILKMISVFLGN